jgi:hypothetical protein
MDSFNVFIAPLTYPAPCGAALRGLVRANCFLPNDWQPRLKNVDTIANSGGAGQAHRRQLTKQRTEPFAQMKNEL